VRDTRPRIRKLRRICRESCRTTSTRCKRRGQGNEKQKERVGREGEKGERERERENTDRDETDLRMKRNESGRCNDTRAYSP